MTTLPRSKQTWAHSTVSKDLLDRALKDPSVTAIETDVLLGYNDDDDDATNDDDAVAPTTRTSTMMMIPIAAHPPDTVSDLSVRGFLERVRETRHHIKLDFKEEAVVRPTLELLRNMMLLSTSRGREHHHDDDDDEEKSRNEPTAAGAAAVVVVVREEEDRRTFFLNADVLAGPGTTDRDVKVRAEPFLETALEFASTTTTTTVSSSSSSRVVVALSLGWTVDVCHPSGGYTADHVEEMKDVLRRGGVVVDDVDDEQQERLPVVLAVNARLLAKSPPEPFLAFLRGGGGEDDDDAGRRRQLLVWTGAGEPPIGSGTTLRELREMYAEVSDRVGYDVRTTDNVAEAAVYDAIMWVLGWKNVIVRRLLRRSRSDDEAP